jgi:di/tricarboxylate transporter
MFGLSYEAGATLVILVSAVGLLASQRIRIDLIALFVMVSLIVSGILTAEETFASFGRPLIVIVVGIFVLGAGLRETGVPRLISNYILHWCGEDRRQVIVVVMLSAALLSSVLSGLLVASILMPAVLRIADEHEIPPSQLLLPLGVASTLGGQLTLIGAPANIVVSDLLSQAGGREFGFFTLTPYALLALGVAIAWFYFLSSRTLKAELPDKSQEPSVEEAEEIFGLKEMFYRLRVRSTSNLIGVKLADSELSSQYGLNVVAVQSLNGKLRAATPDWVLEQDSELVVEMIDGQEGDVHRAAHHRGLEPLGRVNLSDFAVTAQRSLYLTEIVVPHRSSLIGQSLAEIDLRGRYNLQVLAVNRRGESISTQLPTMRLEVGDILLVEGAPEQARQASNGRDLVAITDLSPSPEDIVTSKASIALAILAGMVLLVMVEVVSLAVALLLASLALILTRCLTVDRAYAAINPTILVVIGGMLPLGTALQKTGAAQLLASAMLGVGEYIGALGTLFLLYVTVSLLTQVIPDSIVAAIFTPVAVSLASAQGLSLQHFAVPIAFAVSASYVSPLTSAINLMIKDKGKYELKDYLINNVPIFLLTGGAVFSLLMLFGLG